MLETPYATGRNPIRWKLLLLLTHGPGPAWAGKMPLGPSKNLAQMLARDADVLPRHPAPSFCLDQGAFFLPRRALAHESVAKGVSSIRGF